MSSTFKPGSVARVVKDYQAAYPDPFVTRAGEELLVGERDTQWPAYVWCTNREGEGRWVPESYLDRTGDIGIAHCDYSAVELTVIAGEEVVLEKEAGGWFWVTNQEGQSGWVPAEHVELP